MKPVRDVPAAPVHMPAAVDRDRRGCAARRQFAVDIETISPILGGAAELRSIDCIDIIRVPTIRGHLRFWWRALQSVFGERGADLFDKETTLWGQAAGDSGSRSAVEITVEILRRGVVQPAPEDYVFWPARSTASGLKEAQVRRTGMQFRLIVKVASDDADVAQVRNSVRAWILFGGYGSRTRRGAGSLTVIGNDKAEWLPAIDDEGEPHIELLASLEHLFGTDIFAAGPLTADFPRFAGAALLIGRDSALNPDSARKTAIGWLRDFRQEQDVARERGADRPGRSRWPEADKLRHLTGQFGHPARYRDATPAWPRAGFGLPIVGRFQREGGGNEPPDFLLTWQDKAGAVRERMASRLIVKALPTLQGARPCLLWLARSNPDGMQVIARRADSASKTWETLPNSGADPDHMGSAGDQADARRLNAPLTLRTSLQTAFNDWVRRKGGAVQVTP
jgi:CRISPR-associated protein Cmr1